MADDINESISYLCIESTFITLGNGIKPAKASIRSESNLRVKSDPFYTFNTTFLTRCLLTNQNNSLVLHIFIPLIAPVVFTYTYIYILSHSSIPLELECVYYPVGYERQTLHLWEIN